LKNKIFLFIFLFFFCVFAQEQDDDIEIILDEDDEIILDEDGEQEEQFSGKMPVQIEFVEAEYDSSLFAQGIFGDVVMNLLISENGDVDSVSIVESLNEILDEAATVAAKKFKFQPAMLYDTIPVAVIVQYVYRFSINEELYEEEIISYDTSATNAVQSDFDNYEVVAYYKGEEKEVARHKLTISEMRKIPGLSGDAVKVVQALPGVARPAATLGTVIVRGTSTNDSKFLLDGTDLFLLYHFGGMKSTYNSEALESIDFYPGGWNVKYGDATGGVVELKSRKPRTDGYHGYLELSALDMSFMAEGPIGEKWSVLGTARRSHFGEIIKLAMKISGADNMVTLAPFYWDYVVRADFAPNDRHQFTFSSFSSNDSLAVILNEDATGGSASVTSGSAELREATNTLTQRLFFSVNGINWNFKITDNLQNFLAFKTENVYSSFGAMGFARSLTEINGFRYHDNLSWQIKDRTKINFGLDGYLGVVDMELDMIGYRGLIRHKRDDWVFSRTGVYANFEIKPVERWLIVPGIRYDYYSELLHDGSILPEFWDYGEKLHKGISGEPSFRLSSRYALNDKHLIKGALGTYNQSPKPQGQVIDSLYGNPNLPTTNAAHYVLGYEWQITDLISLDVQGYVNRQWNIPRMASYYDITTAKTVDDIKMYYSDAIGRSRGIEIMLRHNQNDRFFGWIAYTLSKSERKNPRINAISKSGWANYAYDQTNNLQFLASYKLPKNWEIGGRLRYTTGNPTTPIVGIEYDLTSNSVDRIGGVPNSERMDPFFQFDFRAEKKWNYKKSNLAVYFDIQNLSYFIYKSPEFILYNDFYTERHIISMPIIPSLGVRYDF